MRRIIRYACSKCGQEFKGIVAILRHEDLDTCNGQKASEKMLPTEGGKDER